MKARYDMVQCYVVRQTPTGFDFLQLRRAAGDFMGGTWQSIYGGIKESETAWQAALRELLEETGLTPLEFYQLDTVNTFYLAKDDSIWNCPGFCAIVAAGARIQLNVEHEEYRWRPREQFLAELVWPGERMACAELCREILDDGPAKPFLRIAL